MALCNSFETILHEESYSLGNRENQQNTHFIEVEHYVQKSKNDEIKNKNEKPSRGRRKLRSNKPTRILRPRLAREKAIERIVCSENSIEIFLLFTILFNIFLISARILSQ